MKNIKEDISGCLNALKGGGNFFSMNTVDFVFPGLKVEGIAELAYPINENQAKALIQQAHKAHFGKGHETILDTSVRSAWEIDAEKLSFTGNQWTKVISKIIKNIQPEMGLEDCEVSAHLYKMLIYEKGDFFLPHKDTEKEKGMFGTLVIGLPSHFTGGSLHVCFDGEEAIADFSEPANNYTINYAAFYADCDHEVKPLTSGYRICLVYNLVQQKIKESIQPIPVAESVEKLSLMLKAHQDRELQPLIVLLGHQYTPENFSADSLKLNDRAKAQLLFRAAQQANYYAKMCLVTSYLSGEPADGGGRYWDDEYDDDENTEMGEVYDESLDIQHWVQSDIPKLSNLKFEEEDLVASFKLDDDEPIVKESTGYQGNWGPDVMHWYHYGAVVIWSHKTNAQLLPEQNLESQLNWLNYFNGHPSSLSKEEATTINLLLKEGLKNSKHDSFSYNSVADWVINSKDMNFFDELNEEQLQLYFVKIEAGHWLKLLEFLSPEISQQLFDRITQHLTHSVLAQLLAVCVCLSAVENGKYNHLITTTQLKKLPEHPLIYPVEQSEYSWRTDPKSITEGFPTPVILNDIFLLELAFPQSETWIQRMAERLTEIKQREYINNILVSELLALKTLTPLAQKLIDACKQYLQNQVDNKPQPPTDWRREMPKVSLYYEKQWKVLEEFILSPTEMIFDYRALQALRNGMEGAIKNVTVDLKMETIKKGSPHILRITKTQASYERKLNAWEEDEKLLKKLSEK
jgi:hypothetical protein